MEDDAPVIHGLGDFQARAITSQVAETEAIRFLVGTQSLRHDNEIHQIDFDDESNLINKNVFLHRDGEIWQISSSPLDKNILATCYNQTSEARAEMRASLWRIPADFNSQVPDDNGASQSLELLAHFTQEEGDDMKGILWHPSGESSQVIALSESHIQLCDVEESGESITVASSTALEGRGHPKFTCASWNPHHNSTQIATANDTCIRGWDLRTMKQSYVIENAHGQLVRDIDFNPNKQYYLASCGDDCRAKFWDVRNPTEPVKILSDHSHWVWCIRYNNFHDQLVLTSSSDARVILTNVASISSEPFGHLVDEEGLDDGDDEEQKNRSSEPISDGVISTYEEHEDSVYTTAWSTTDPWLFASLSFDGRFVINRVPKKTKYRILL